MSAVSFVRPWLSEGTTYVALAFSNTMLEDGAIIRKRVVSPDWVRDRIESGDVISACNPSHAATLGRVSALVGITIPIPEKAPNIFLKPGDTLIVLQARFGNRLAEGDTRTQDEVDRAGIEFSAIEVMSVTRCVILPREPMRIVADEITRGIGYPIFGAENKWYDIINEAVNEF